MSSSTEESDTIMIITDDNAVACNESGKQLEIMLEETRKASQSEPGDGGRGEGRATITITGSIIHLT